MYVSLTNHSYFSFLDGASSPEALAVRAAKLQMRALALTDRNGLYGVIPFYHKCREVGIKPIIGATLSVEGGDTITLLCLNQEGYVLLSQLISKAYQGKEKGEAEISKSWLSDLSAHCICLLGERGSLFDRAVRKGSLSTARSILRSYVMQFGRENVYITLSNHLIEGDEAACSRLKLLACEEKLPLVAVNSVRYAEKEDGLLHDVLRCIKEGVTLDESHHHLFGNHHHYLKGDEEMRLLFQEYPEALENTHVIAERCNVTLDFSRYRFPTFEVPTGETVDTYLSSLCYGKIGCRYSSSSLPAVREKLAHELKLIQKLDLSGYFLIVWDIVEFAKSKNIPVQGRGSAANSLVAYVLGITPVDPIAHQLFLGRFLHDEMTSLPDIDLDFASARDPSCTNREDVIQYIYGKYGRDHVAMACTFVTFQGRSGIREVGKVLGMPSALLEKMARVANHGSTTGSLRELSATKEFADVLASSKWELFRQLLEKISNVPRHMSIHVGGMIIASTPIADIVPIEPARMEGRIVIQWDKDMIEDAGLIKIDILGLGMLAVLRETGELVAESCGQRIALDEIPVDDPKVYDTIAAADTVGVFQVESRAQMQSLPRTKPRNFEELGVQVAIIRPGPLQGNMVSPYIRRKQGLEPVVYPHPSLEPILKETLGVILFQEQVLKVAVAAAGFSPAQADALRRAMSRKRSKEAMEKLKDEFLQGAAARGIGAIDAGNIFQTLEGFALYGFCKSHALSFARISYVSAWLKLYYPVPFVAALLNNQPMGFYPNETLIEDAKRHGVQVRQVDVNYSRERCHVEEGALRVGLILVQGVSDDVASAIVSARNRRGPFRSVRDLMKRVVLPKKALENLIQAGALDCWGLERRELLWQLWLLQREGLQEGLFEDPLKPPPLPTSTAWELMGGEFRSMGFSPDKHPLALLRPRLDRQIASAKELEDVCDEDPITVAGMIICRQRPPTAKGYAFLTLEDESGMMNVIIPPWLYEQQRALIRQEPILVVSGTLQRQDNVTNVKASFVRRLEDDRQKRRI